MSEAVEEGGAPLDPVKLGALFIGFLKVALCAFGSGLVPAHRVIVEQKRWMDEREFADTLTICQFLPGPNIIGIAVCAGVKLRGTIGAIAAGSGFLVIPWGIGLSFGVLYLRHADLPVLQNILSGFSAAAAGQIIATGVRLLTQHKGQPTWLLFAVLAFVGIAFAKLPLLVVLAGLAPCSMVLAGFQSTRDT
jgi:chromate transporter